MFRLPKADRLVRRSQFEALYSAPGKRAGRYLVVFSAPAPAGVLRHRLGTTAAKRTFHDSCERNRAKRLLRESFRLLRPEIPGPPRDFVLVARRPILSAREPQVRADFSSILRKNGLMTGR